MYPLSMMDCLLLYRNPWVLGTILFNYILILCKKLLSRIILTSNVINQLLLLNYFPSAVFLSEEKLPFISIAQLCPVNSLRQCPFNKYVIAGFINVTDVHKLPPCYWSIVASIDRPPNAIIPHRSA